MRCAERICEVIQNHKGRSKGKDNQRFLQVPGMVRTVSRLVPDGVMRNLVGVKSIVRQTDRKVGGCKRVLSTSGRSYWRKISSNWHREYDLLQSVLASVKKAQ